MPRDAWLFVVLGLQMYGGAPPWGTAAPVKIRGEVRRGEKFERDIGNGLRFRLAPTDVGWRVEVGDGGEDFSRCVTPPFHGLTSRDIEAPAFRNDDNTASLPENELRTPGVGAKRWFDFELTRSRHE